MDDNFGEWVESIGVIVGVVSRRWVWLVVRRNIDILTIIIDFPYSTCISSFLAAASLLLCSFLKCFFVLVYVLFLKYIANVTQRTLKVVQKNRDHANIII